MIEEIIEAVTTVTGITEAQMKSRSQQSEIYIARGMYYLICKKAGISHLDMAKRINRTAQGAIASVSRYMSRCESDKELRHLRDKIINYIEGYSEVIEYLWDEAFYVMDTTSMYFGEYYIGYINGEPYTSGRSFYEVANRMIDMRKEVA